MIYIVLLDGTFRTLSRRGPPEGLGIFQFLFLRFLLVPSVGFSLFIFSPLLLIILIFISHEERWTPDIEGYNLRTIEFVEHRLLRAACFENIFRVRFIGKLFLPSCRP